MNRTPLIYKVLSNAASESEKKAMEDWLEESEENKTEFDNVKLLWETSNNPDSSFPKIQMVEGLTKIKALMQPKFMRRERSWRNLVWTALLLIGVLMFTDAYLKNVKNKDSRVRLKFNNVSVEEVVKTLEDEYDVRIELDNKKIGACRFTGVFYQAENVDEILQILDQALSFRHQRKQKSEYLVTGTGCQNH